MESKPCGQCGDLDRGRIPPPWEPQVGLGRRALPFSVGLTRRGPPTFPKVGLTRRGPPTFPKVGLTRRGPPTFPLRVRLF